MRATQEPTVAIREPSAKASENTVSIGKMMESALEARRSAGIALRNEDIALGMRMFRDYGFRSAGVALLYSKLDTKAQSDMGWLVGEFLLDSAYGFMMAGDYRNALGSAEKAKKAFAQDAKRIKESKGDVHDPQYVISECKEMAKRCAALKSDLRDVQSTIQNSPTMIHSDREYRDLVGSAFEKALRP